MSDPKKELEDMINNAKNSIGGGGNIWTPGQEEYDPISLLAMTVQRCEIGMAHLSRTNALIGRASDVGHLTMQMILGLMIEKGLVTKEELDKKYKEEVIEKYKKIEEEIRKEAEKQIKEQYEEAKESIKEAEEESNTVAAAAEEVISNITENKNE